MRHLEDQSNNRNAAIDNPNPQPRKDSKNKHTAPLAKIGSSWAHHGTSWDGWDGIAWYGTVRYGAVRYGTVRYGVNVWSWAWAWHLVADERADRAIVARRTEVEVEERCLPH